MRRSWTLHQLQLFATVARLGSFTRAAETLHISQPSVSARIHDLEAIVGQELFESEGRRTYLTPAGEELLEHAEAILQRVAEAHAALEEMDTLERGSLRVVATTTVGSYVLPRVFGRFHQLYPGISLTLHVTNWTHGVELLRGRQMDLAVLGPTDQLEDMDVYPFLKNELVVAAYPSHPLAGRKNVPFHELADYPMLVREEGSGTRLDTERLFLQHGVRPRITMELRHSAAIKQGVVAGLGVALLSKQSMNLHLAAGELVILDVEDLPLRREWHIVHRRGQQLSRAVAAFRDVLREYAAEVEAKPVWNVR